MPLLERILRLRPDDPTAHAMLAVLEYREGNCKAAVAHFDKAGAADRHAARCAACPCHLPGAAPALRRRHSRLSTRRRARTGASQTAPAAGGRAADGTEDREDAIATLAPLLQGRHARRGDARSRLRRHTRSPATRRTPSRRCGRPFCWSPRTSTSISISRTSRSPISRSRPASTS